jgi:hypothetical protein
MLIELKSFFIDMTLANCANFPWWLTKKLLRASGVWKYIIIACEEDGLSQSMDISVGAIAGSKGRAAGAGLTGEELGAPLASSFWFVVGGDGAWPWDPQELMMAPRVTTALRTMAGPKGKNTNAASETKIASAIFIVRLRHASFSIGGVVGAAATAADRGVVACMIRAFGLRMFRLIRKRIGGIQSFFSRVIIKSC